VRDRLRGIPPHDWDLATAWSPEVIQRWGERLGYRVIPTGLAFGTVTILTEDGPVEITTFRKDGRYTDGRHPNTVTYAETIEEDLSRRDFTMNAMALTLTGDLIDLFGGKSDLHHQRIKTVGDPADRFQEDPLRMWRAVRFVGMGMELETATAQAIWRYKPLLAHVSRERQRDELMKLLTLPRCQEAMQVAVNFGVLPVVWPEWFGTMACDQRNPHHLNKTVEQHLLATMAAGTTPLMRLVGLLHDIAKPSCYWLDPQETGHFYGHDALGAVYARSMLERLAFDKKTVDRVCRLIEHHMFPWEESGKPAIRRMIREHGEAVVQDLLELRRMDIVGSGRRWETEGCVRAKVQAVMEEVPVAKRTLAVSGHDVMEVAGIPPGPLVGEYLTRLQTWVDDDPARNSREQLLEQIQKGRD